MGNGNPRVLVTGGAGYVGAVLVPELLKQGYSVDVVDNFQYDPTSLFGVAHDENLSLTCGDVRDKTLMSEAIKRADIIIPLAAQVGAPRCAKDPIAASTTNRDAAVFLIQKASASQLILMPTTNSAYGTTPQGTICDERSELNPLSLYAREKVEVEQVLMSRENSVSFRFATVFGLSPRPRLDLLVNDFVYRAVKDRFIVLFEPHFRRNFLHVRDAAGVFVWGIEHAARLRGEIFNVGLSDANLSKWELCQVIRRQLPDFVFTQAPVGNDPDQRNYLVSNAKIEKAGFQTKHSLEGGIGELIKGFRCLTMPYRNH